MSRQRPLYGYTGAGDKAHLIRRDNAALALCAAQIMSVPHIQPVQPGVACPDCWARALHGAPYRYAPPPSTGVCPECVSEEDLDEHGLVKPHRQMYGLRRSDVDCPGGGLKPEVTL